jgi:hypothetical protein
VDEAHLLDREMLEEVRFLLNFKMDAESPLALVLAGQNELGGRLELKPYTAIRQRVDIRCRLSSLDRAETGGFIPIPANVAVRILGYWTAHLLVNFQPNRLGCNTPVIRLTFLLL